MPNVWPSSTLTTPSLPTWSIASAITSPISLIASRDRRHASDLILAGDLHRRLLDVGDDVVDGLLDPRLSRAGGAGGDVLETLGTIAGPGPSGRGAVPATSLVAVATSRTSCAPWFWKTSSTSISRAIVTPSLVIVGAPNFLSRTT